MGLPITFLSDYGVADDFAGICRAVIARIAPGTEVIDITHGIGRHDVREGAAALVDAVPYAPVAVHLAIVDPGVGGPRRAIAVRCRRRRPPLRRPRQRAAAAGDRLLRRRRPRRSTSAPRPSGSSPPRRPSTAATSSPRSPPTSRPARSSPRPGCRSTPSCSSVMPVSRPRLEQLRALAHADRIDGFGNIALDLDRRRPRSATRWPAPAGSRSAPRSRRRTAHPRRVLRPGRRRQLPLLRGLVREGWRSRQPRRRQRRARDPRRRRDRAGARPLGEGRA